MEPPCSRCVGTSVVCNGKETGRPAKGDTVRGRGEADRGESAMGAEGETWPVGDGHFGNARAGTVALVAMVGCMVSAKTKGKCKNSRPRTPRQLRTTHSEACSST
eukprot:TRINITY_DN47580_c0_g1_i1.p3 TRINITY_DN47580_c0_g1~~TRINITY_DN47580_c0_g1_i1.p3  ORF type:complete len:105 (-),score=10.86 TRINITY_DN47580_c0_g1_i1:12-326(-)